MSNAIYKTQLLELYWEIAKDVDSKLNNTNWGSNLI